MKRIIVQPADLSVEALAEFKQWLGISQPNEDAQLQQLLHASMELCEGFIRQMPIESGSEEILQSSRDWQCLDTCPVRAITGVSAIASDGSRITVASGNFEIEIDADGKGKVRLLALPSEGKVVVSFVAGIAANWGSLPDGLRQGILRAAAFLYRDRDSAGAATPPASISALWLPWRRIRIA